MYVKRLELSNFQVIENFACSFEGNVYFFTGDNELGKSTLLKAIGIMLTGSRDAVLQNGKDKGFSKMIVGDDKENYEVELKFTKSNPRGTLTIKSPDGMKSDNISMLQKIFGYTDFDAVEFSRWSETAEGRRKQIEVVKKLLPEKVQSRLIEIDNEVVSIRETRKDLNAELKQAKSIFDISANEVLFNVGPESDYHKFEKEVDLKDSIDKQSKIIQIQEKAKTVKNTLNERIDQLSKIPDEIKSIESEYKKHIEDLNTSDQNALAEYNKSLELAKSKYEESLRLNGEKKEQLKAANIEDLEAIKLRKEDLEQKKSNCEKWISEYESKNYPSNLEDIIKEGNEHNKKCVLLKDHKEKLSKKEACEKKVNEIESKLSNLLTERENLIKESKLPVKGLSFTDDGLEMSGVPFVSGKVSDSQIMEVAVKLVIASNPKVKVFRIARGESLGQNRLRDIIEIAKKNGFQGFIEEVKRGQDEIIVDEYTEK